MFWLNGILLPGPSDMSVGIHDITRAARTASGLMQMEFIARKRTITIEYALISDTDLNAILTNLHSRVFHALRYPDAEGERTITVYHGDRNYNPYNAFYIIAGARWWENVKIPLIER